MVQVTLLETTDRQLLLTRRGRHMRTFPGVWVPPGGHIELGETLLEAGARECWEETGLQVTISNIIKVYDTWTEHFLVAQQLNMSSCFFCVFVFVCPIQIMNITK